MSWLIPKKEALTKNRHLLDNFVATKAGDKLSRRSHSEIPLEIDTPAISALLHQVQPRHARPVLRNRKTPLVIKRMRSLVASWKKQKTEKFSFSTVCLLAAALKTGCVNNPEDKETLISARTDKRLILLSNREGDYCILS